MGKTHISTWKRRERDAAALFGARRKVLSGSSGRDDETQSDSTHPQLYIETKLRAASATRRLWEDTDERAEKEKKTPVLALYDKRLHGALLVVHEDDMDAVAAAWLEARDEREMAKEKPPCAEGAG